MIATITCGTNSRMCEVSYLVDEFRRGLEEVCDEAEIGDLEDWRLFRPD